MTEERELSDFQAKELIPLFVLQQLSDERRSLVQIHLKNNKGSQKQLEKLERAKKYLLGLRAVRPEPNLVSVQQKMIQSWPTFTKKLDPRNWPMTLRWTAELAVLAVALVTTVELLPWIKIVKRVQVFQEEKVARQQESKPAPPTAEDTTGTDSPDNEAEIGAGLITPPAEKVPAKPVVVAKPPEPSKTEDLPPGTSLAAAKTDADAPSPSNYQGKGFLFRGDLTANKTIGEPDSIRITIEGLGGEKAGQVRLGWRRETGRYYHFTLPENKYEALLTQLRGIGDLRVHRESHPRVMPKGTLRIILNVEEPGGTSNESEQSSEPGTSSGFE